jgi:hypothetical protein
VCKFCTGEFFNNKILLLSFLLVQVLLNKNNLRMVIKLELFVKNPCRHRSCARIVITSLI